MFSRLHNNWIFALSLGVIVTFLSNGFSAEPQPAETARKIDQMIAKELHSGVKEKPVPTVDDEQFLRRVMLDLIGQPPTVEDVLAFSLDPAENKRTKLVEKLLANPSFGDNWAGYWRDVIFYRNSEQRSFIAVRPTTEYLAKQYNQNTPWDEIAKSFITAKGDVRTTGQAGLIAAQAGRPEETVAEISRIFMGIQIQCAQCHDHPTDRWKREQFHNLAAFFPRVALRPNRAGLQRTFVVSANDNGRRPRRTNGNNRYVGTLEHYMPNLDKPTEKGKLMQPVFFLSDQKLKLGTKDAERRGKLAEWVTSEKNHWFAKAYVNRIWSELVGEGFYEPVDDIGPDRECSAPKTLDYLATAFVSSGHDTKWLFQTITATEAYQRQSRSRRNADQPPMIASCNQRLRADQLFNSLVTVLNIEDQIRKFSQQRRAQVDRTPRGVFNTAFGYDPSVLREEIAGSIPQALVMMNSPFLNREISSSRGRLSKLLGEIKSDRDLTAELYLITLARQPTEGETKTCVSYVRKVGNRKEAFEDLLWSLINSTEFIHRR